MIVFIDRLALGLIGVYCLLSAMFTSYFAKVHLAVSFCPMPIFVSEILLAILIVLLGIKVWLTRGWHQLYGWWILWLAIILVYAVLGYMAYGPLALRNAALFYYTLFALFGYAFFDRALCQKNWLMLGVIMIIVGALVFRQIDNYFWLTCNVLAAAFIIRRFEKQAWWLIIIMVMFSNWGLLFGGSRAHFLGIGAVGIFLILMLISFLPASIPVKAHRWIRIGLIVMFIGAGVALADKNAIKSMIDVKSIANLYQKYEAYIIKNRPKYEADPINYQIYNQKDPSQEIPKPSREFVSQLKKSYDASNKDFNLYNKPVDVSLEGELQKKSDKIKQLVDGLISSKQPTIIEDQGEEVRLPYQHILKEVESYTAEDLTQSLSTHSKSAPDQSISPLIAKSTESPKYRDIIVAYNNILFRYFIWRDMWRDMLKHHVVLGVGFGLPQRSSSLEILGWAIGEWPRDGWIAPHNAYLHMIYRAGIFGLIVIVILVGLIVKLTRHFMRTKNIKAVLLVSILLYWAVLAMFSVTLEVPYNAILFWSLLGMLVAYAFKQERV